MTTDPTSLAEQAESVVDGCSASEVRSVVKLKNILLLYFKRPRMGKINGFSYSYLSKKRAASNKRSQAQIIQNQIKVHNTIPYNTIHTNIFIWTFTPSKISKYLSQIFKTFIDYMLGKIYNKAYSLELIEFSILSVSKFGDINRRSCTFIW